MVGEAFTTCIGEHGDERDGDGCDGGAGEVFGLDDGGGGVGEGGEGEGEIGGIKGADEEGEGFADDIGGVITHGEVG